MSASAKNRRALVDLTEAAYAPAETDGAWLEGLLTIATPILDGGSGVLAYFVDARRRRIHGVVGDRALAEAVVPMHATRGAQSFDMYHKPRALALRHVYGAEAKVDTTRFLGAGVGDIWGVTCVDASGEGVVLTAPQGRRQRMLLGTRAWTMAAAHIAAGYRLRRRPAQADAILSARGEILHCEGGLEKRRKALAAAVKDRLDTRRAAWRVGSEAALEAWRVLTDGTWSIVETVDSDGKRLLVAKRNPVALDAVEPLDDVERQICAMTVAGHSQKLIAYELGLHASAVGRRLRSALVKLGLRSAAELARYFAWLPASTAAD